MRKTSEMARNRQSKLELDTKRHLSIYKLYAIMLGILPFNIESPEEGCQVWRGNHTKQSGWWSS